MVKNFFWKLFGAGREGGVEGVSLWFHFGGGLCEKRFFVAGSSLRLRDFSVTCYSACSIKVRRFFPLFCNPIFGFFSSIKKGELAYDHVGGVGGRGECIFTFWGKMVT